MVGSNRKEKYTKKGWNKKIHEMKRIGLAIRIG